MKKALICIFIIMIAAASLFAADQKGKKPVLPLDPDMYLWHFGMIPRDATVAHHYALTNNHKKTVTITEIISDCDCTKIPQVPIAVAPGQTYMMKISFNTKTYFGETNRDIHLVTDFEPAPEMTVYFTSLASRVPNTVSITPRTTAFITGKNSQKFVIENLADEKTSFTFFIDNDSTFEVSELEFTLKGKQKREIVISPKWDLIPPGSHYSCLVLEVARKEKFSVSIPLKINKF